MPINYAVQAQVVDLRTDTPRATDRFYVDTCVWFWTAYSRIGLAPKPPKPYLPIKLCSPPRKPRESLSPADRPSCPYFETAVIHEFLGKAEEGD